MNWHAHFEWQDDATADKVSILVDDNGQMMLHTSPMGVYLSGQVLADFLVAVDEVVQGPLAHEHVLVLKEHEWQLRHASGCRRRPLDECPFGQASIRQAPGWGETQGIFRVVLDDQGRIELREEVTP